jgi:hypothetical protein
MESVQLRVMYDGVGPVSWSRRPTDFGLQDKERVLHAGTVGVLTMLSRSTWGFS